MVNMAKFNKVELHRNLLKNVWKSGIIVLMILLMLNMLLLP